ncbi:MAG: hypothetical protein ACI8X5_003473 [Planctomycetota bacterium]|jgi:hypothetical protein
MIQMRSLSVLGSVLAGFGAIGAGTQMNASIGSVDGGKIQREPVVMFDVSGGTLLGAYAEHLIVYNDGYASYSIMSPFEEARVEGRMLPGNGAANLLEELEKAGAFEMTDAEGEVSDVPLTTVTVFQGGTNAAAHSFSYWLSSGPQGMADDVLSDFIFAQFSALER